MRQACNRECDKIGPDCEVVVFPWSGKNLPKEREKAATNLRAFLEEQAARCDALFVIGHSHGGLVATRAIAPTASERDAFQDKWRCHAWNALSSCETWGRVARWGVTLLAESVAFILVVWGLAALGLEWITLTEFKRVIVLFFSLEIFFFTLRLGCKWWQSFAEQKAAKFFGFWKDRFQYPMLCVYDDRDEAFWWLRIQSFVVTAAVLVSSVGFLVMPLLAGLILSPQGRPELRKVMIVAPILVTAITAALLGGIVQGADGESVACLSAYTSGVMYLRLAIQSGAEGLTRYLLKLRKGTSPSALSVL